MSYDLQIFFRSPNFPDKEWLEILSWFDAIEETIEPELLVRWPYLRKEWFISVGGYGVFVSLKEHHPRLHFEDQQANWEVSIDTGSGLGLRQFFGFTLCYCTLSLIPNTSVWDRGEFFDTLYQEPHRFLKNVNTIINTNRVYSENYALKLKMQQMGVLNDKFRLIPDPHVLKLAAESDLYNGQAYGQLANPCLYGIEGDL